MKRIAIAVVACLAGAPAMASYNHNLRSGEFEVEPSHCVHDALYGWNCWYKPVEREFRWRHEDPSHHHHYPHYRPHFRPNRWNEHGTPCYFYKKNGWCF